MTGTIISIPPQVEQPPGQSSSNPAGLPGVTYVPALLNVGQTWTAKQIFPLGNISLNAADITGTLPAGDLPLPTASTLGGIKSIASASTKWINSIGTDGVPTQTQPAFSDISGTSLPSAVFANPSGSIGLTANNGTATTPMRSDATPALSQSITPAWTGLHSYTSVAAAGGIKVTGNPNLNVTNTQLGLTTGWSALSDVTAASATAPEGSGSFNITSGVGSANLTTAFKIALSATATSNPGSASVWAQSNVATLAPGGTARGAIVYEADMDNFYGNFGSVSNPYAANIMCTGQNWNGSSGGYSDAAIVIQFAQTGRNANPMWNYGVYFGAANFTAFNTATIYDESNSPTILKAVGAHATGIDISAAAISGNAILAPGFSVSGTTGAIASGSAGFATGALKLNGVTSGTATLTVPAAAGSPTLTLPTATDTLVGRATTDTLSNKTLVNVKVSQQTIAGAQFDTSPSASSFSIATAANAAVTNVETGSIMILVEEHGVAGQAAVYIGTGGTTSLVGGSAFWVAPTSTPAAGKFSVQFDGGTNTYRIYNAFGSTGTFTASTFKFR